MLLLQVALLLSLIIMVQDFHNNHKGMYILYFHTSSLWTTQEVLDSIATLKQKYNTQFVYQTHENTKDSDVTHNYCLFQLHVLQGEHINDYHCKYH